LRIWSRAADFDDGIYGALLFSSTTPSSLCWFLRDALRCCWSLLALAIWDALRFMAFLGIASLIAFIVSHVIVLFDFIEEMHEAGRAVPTSHLRAGIGAPAAVLITVGATILALFLWQVTAALWKPLCYAQIGGLAVATSYAVLVPVFYSIAVLD